MNSLKEINIKNRTFYYFDDIIQVENVNFGNILLHEKSYENILVYDILYKTLTGTKPLRISFDKKNRFIRAFDRTGYLVLFGPEIYNAIYNRIRYLISQKIGITYVISHNYERIKADSCDSLPNVMIRIKSVFNKNQNHYYYNIFLGEYSYQSSKTTTINKFLYKSYVLYYDKTDVSEEIDVTKTRKSKEHDIFHYWYI